uniref:AlNc14C126G6826 protein n=1 Tax=Albugo laibachii Nc14 TaxID=890382 RepID=F0WJV6_9STRA|nr:AlNc14C126G6826 [Albugo laibachii Nc14]|eukprot:CCA21558.1 AlNc14C126G6826 [Albugo laibachii Nc14]
MSAVSTHQAPIYIATKCPSIDQESHANRSVSLPWPPQTNEEIESLLVYGNQFVDHAMYQDEESKMSDTYTHGPQFAASSKYISPTSYEEDLFSSSACSFVSMHKRVQYSILRKKERLIEMLHSRLRAQSFQQRPRSIVPKLSYQGTSIPSIGELSESKMRGLAPITNKVAEVVLAAASFRATPSAGHTTESAIIMDDRTFLRFEAHGYKLTKQHLGDTVHHLCTLHNALKSLGASAQVLLDAANTEKAEKGNTNLVARLSRLIRDHDLVMEGLKDDLAPQTQRKVKLLDRFRYQIKKRNNLRVDLLSQRRKVSFHSMI